MICCLQEFFKNWAVAVEALATVALVIAAFIQWGTMRAQARQERDRWKREDEIRAEENKPKAEFGLRRKTDMQMELWCANLGSVSFLVTKMLIYPINVMEYEAYEIPLEPHFVVSVGEMREVTVPVMQHLNPDIVIRYAGVALTLRGPSGETDTKKTLVPLGQIYTCLASTVTSEQMERIQCPDCLGQFEFSLQGLTEFDDCKNQIASVKQECAASCPNHASANSRVTFGTQASCITFPVIR